MAKTHRTTPATSDALSRAQFFGSPPIIEGEKAKDYRKLLERVFEAIAPADFIEEICAETTSRLNKLSVAVRWNEIAPEGFAEDVSQHFAAAAPGRASNKLPTILAGEEKLRAMDRYERRALSRRRFAIRALDDAKVLGIKSKV